MNYDHDDDNNDSYIIGAVCQSVSQSVTKVIDCRLMLIEIYT